MILSLQNIFKKLELENLANTSKHARTRINLETIFIALLRPSLNVF